MRRAAVLAALACAVLATACGGDPVERWIDLARLEPVETRVPEGELGPGLRLEHEDGVAWAVATLERTAWSAAGAPGLYRALLPVIAIGTPPDAGAPYRLVVDGAVLAHEPDPERIGAEPGRFSTRVLELRIALAPGAPPPERAELRAVLDHEERDPAGGSRIGGRRISGAGFWIAGGGGRAFELAVPPRSCLRFGLALEPVLGGKADRLAARTFRVRLDGATIFERALPGDLLGEALEWHSVELPRGGVRSVRIELEVEGPLALSAFLAPRIGPADPGTYGRRPWSAEGAAPRPDLVLFLADTFRADNLAAYGGAPGLTPEIDRLAGEARVFERAWSTSTHTLPAHSSMFSGVFPHQNGQVDYFHPLPGAVETLAEILAARGYRCGAVTDGVMVSHSHGLDQGFESFDERREVDPVERVRAFLAADDGRPVFLFVQSYAAHTPYATSPETRARLADRLALEHSYEDVYAAAIALPQPTAEAPPEDAATQRVAAALHDLYRAASAELDALFARVRRELETRGVLPGGVLVFTSDHGEAFYEHGRPFHAGRPFEEELRVPLLVLGPGIAPGREPRPVSLVDIAPTFLALAGEAARPGWEGRSLLAPDAARVVYAFQANRAHPGGSAYAVIEGERKLMGLEEGDELHAAFDLRQDPRELDDLLQRAPWPRELAAAQRARLEALLTPLVESEAASFDADKLREMRAMGYDGAPEADGERD